MSTAATGLAKTHRRDTGAIRLLVGGFSVTARCGIIRRLEAGAG